MQENLLDVAEEKNHEQVIPYFYRILDLGEVSTHTPTYSDTRDRKNY